MNWRQPARDLRIGWTHLGGPLLTLTMVAVIELFARELMTSPQPRPLPAMLGFSVVIAALLGGLRSGLASAGIAWLYLFARVAPEAGRAVHLFILGLTYPTVAALISLLQARLLNASRLQAERDAARTQAIELECLIAERTSALVAAQEAQQKQSERIRALYEVSAMPGLSLDERFLALLQRGCRLLDLEHGAIVRFDTALAEGVMTHGALAGAPREPGKRYRLEETYAPYLFEHGGPLAIHDSGLPPWSEMPPARSHARRAYLGDLIVINGQPVGLLSFASDTPRRAPFAQTDQDMVRLMARWVGSAMERHEARLDLEAAYQQLKELSRLKDEFLSTISHEFKTPLTAIKAAAWILEQRLEGELNAKQEGIVSIVITHAEHLHRMINDLLDLSKMESGEMRYRFAEDDVVRLVREVSVSLSQLFAEKRIELALETAGEPLPACIDHDRIRQVLLNMLSNAAKFTSPGGKVTLRLIERSAELRLEVEDTGIGIAPEHTERIFHKFYQVDGSSTRSAGGTGLGLAICKAIVEEGHGGRIWVESALAEGSTFIVTLPRVTRAQPATLSPQP